MMSKNISVIIPSYNSARSIRYTLESILSQTLFEECVLEVLVIDSSDDHDTRPILNEFASDIVRVTFLENKTIPAIGRNIGAGLASGELFVFIDSDIYLEPNWLAEVVGAISKYGCTVGGGSVGIFKKQNWKLLAEAQLYIQFNEFLHTGKTEKRDFLPSCNMFCKKEIFEAVGGFPEIRACEDVLFFLSLKDVADVWFVSSARSRHIFRESLQGLASNQVTLGKYIAVYRKRHKQSVIYKGMFPLILLPLFLVLKSTRMILRILRTGPHEFLHFVYSSPLFFYGLFCWAKGFWVGCLNFSTLKNQD